MLCGTELNYKLGLHEGFQITNLRASLVQTRTSNGSKLHCSHQNIKKSVNLSGHVTELLLRIFSRDSILSGTLHTIIYVLFIIIITHKRS